MKLLLASALFLFALQSKAQQQTTETRQEKADSSAIRNGAFFSKLGGVPSIQLRENPSIPPYVQPLVLVDGKQIDYADVKKINPDRIEFISVLKGKDATLAYGDKATDGVILVRLKKQK